MATLIFILISLAISLIILSQWQMRRFILTAGAIKDSRNIGIIRNLAFIETEYIKLTKNKYGIIGVWFWLEFCSFMIIVDIITVFACIVG